MKLTPKQELFCQHFALSGNGTRAALRSGTRKRESAEVLASRWLRKVQVRERIEKVRAQSFSHLRNQVSRQLFSTVEIALRSGITLPRANRAIKLANRLGVFQHYQQTTKEIADLEARFGVPFEQTLDATLAAQLALQTERAEG